MRIAVLDYGSGNLHSVRRALAAAGADVLVTASAEDIWACQGLVVPGVGAFAACMAGLKAVGGDALMRDWVASGRPMLGICVGHQVMFSRGVEHGEDTAGVGLLPGVVERLNADRLPHMGWNTVLPPAETRMFTGLERERFYFVHSYAVHPVRTAAGLGESPGAGAQGVETPRSPAEAGAQRPGLEAGAANVTLATHGGDTFIAAVERDNLWSTQFHPEKSGQAGSRLLQNWLALS